MDQPYKCQQSYQPHHEPVSFSAVLRLYTWKQHLFQLECIYANFHIGYLKAFTENQTDASCWESLPGNELYQYVLELVNVLARMLVEITIS